MYLKHAQHLNISTSISNLLSSCLSLSKNSDIAQHNHDIVISLHYLLFVDHNSQRRHRALPTGKVISNYRAIKVIKWQLNRNRSVIRYYPNT